MSVTVFGVAPGSPAAKKKVSPGDSLVSINGNEICDVLDYRFYAQDEKLRLQTVNARGRTRRFTVRAGGDPDAVGLSFETYLMDRQRACRNRCIFCFIDQMPKGLRESLYFKDDDARLSFLFGNYITLTNLSERDVSRIERMHISPVNVSVHTMDPALRVKMMRNPKAGECLSLLRRFSDAGIELNAQLVLCPGVNDGEALSFSLRALGELSGVRSVAAVPVGLTRYREGLYPLQKYTPAGAADVIDRIDAFNRTRLAAGLEKLAYPSDEFFQLCGREIPPCEYYGDFPQLENGVGMIASVKAEFAEALAALPADGRARALAVATGLAAEDLLRTLSEDFKRKFPNSRIGVYGIENRFFGPDVTVAGLVTGRDLIDELRERGFSSPRLFVPSVMLRSAEEPVFLDDVTLSQVGQALHTQAAAADCTGEALAALFYGAYLKEE